MNAATIGVLVLIVMLGLLFLSAFIWVLIDTIIDLLK